MLLILTNDLHQWVFSFPANEIWTDKNNSVEFGSFVVFGWEVLCAVAALIIVLLKSRQFQQRRYLPGLIMLCSIVYALDLCQRRQMDANHRRWYHSSAVWMEYNSA